MPRASSSPGKYLALTAGLTIVLLAAWVTWIAAQPACGPYGLSALAHADKWVPWALIAAEAVLLSLAGFRLGQPASRIIVVVITAEVIAIACGGAFDIGRAALGGCFA